MAPSIWSGRQGSLEKGEKRAKGSGQPLRSSASPSRASPVKGGNCCAKKKNPVFATWHVRFCLFWGISSEQDSLQAA